MCKLLWCDVDLVCLNSVRLEQSIAGLTIELSQFVFSVASESLKSSALI